MWLLYCWTLLQLDGPGPLLTVTGSRRTHHSCMVQTQHYESTSTIANDLQNQQDKLGCLLQHASKEYRGIASTPKSKDTALRKMTFFGRSSQPAQHSIGAIADFMTPLDHHSSIHSTSALVTSDARSGWNTAAHRSDANDFTNFSLGQDVDKNMIMIPKTAIAAKVVEMKLIGVKFLIGVIVLSVVMCSICALLPAKKSSAQSGAESSIDAELSKINHATMSKEPLASIAQKMVEEHRHEDNTFESSVQHLLSHISFAPDGGVCNLMTHHKHGQTEQGQPNRHVLVDKGFSGKVTAAILLFCVVINLNTTILEASYIISCYFSGGRFNLSCPHRDKQDELSRKSTLPVPEIALAVAIVELTWGVMLVLQSLFHVVRFSMIRLSSDESEIDVSEKTVVEAYKKYGHLAALAWNNLPEMGSFSALMTLGLAHPGVIGHYAKDQCSSSDRAALKVMKNYLRVDSDEDKDFSKLASSEVHHLGVIQLLRLQLALDKEKGTNETQRVAQQNLHSSMYKLLCQLQKVERNLAVASARAGDKDVEVEVLNLVWRVQMVAVVEVSTFWFWSLFLFLCGVAAFTLKLAFTADNLFDPGVNIRVAMLQILGLLIQVLGLVQIPKLLRWRLFRFIFGGQDAEISTEEKLVERIYEARLAQAIWTSKGMGIFEKLVTLLNLNDDDLQRLMLEEVEYKKAQMIGPLWEAVGRDERQAVKGMFKTYAVKWAMAE